MTSRTNSFNNNHSIKFYFLALKLESKKWRSHPLPASIGGGFVFIIVTLDTFRNKIIVKKIAIKHLPGCFRLFHFPAHMSSRETLFFPQSWPG